MKHFSHIKKRLFFILLSIICWIPANAAFLDNGVWFQQVSETEVEVTFVGAVTGFPGHSNPNRFYVGNITVPSTAYDNSIGKTYNVIGIGQMAFSYAVGLQSVVIQEGIKYIDGSAFLTSSTLSTTVLTSVTLPSSIREIGNNAFLGCGALTTINFPEGLEKIGDSSFWNCEALESVTLPSSLREIGYGAFRNCKSFREIVVPKQIIRIEDYTFQDCENLHTITLPRSLIYLGEGAFLSNYALNNVMIPPNVAFLGASVFSYCRSLTHIEIPEGITVIPNSAFAGCQTLSSVLLPTTLTSIGNSAFQKTFALREINIPYGVASLGTGAFMESGLTSIIVPENVGTIGQNAFVSCESLTSVDIRRTSALSIGMQAFAYCTLLERLSIAVLDPTQITTGSNLFYSIPSSTLMTPCGKRSLYAARTPWNGAVFGGGSRILDRENCAIATTRLVEEITATSAVFRGSIAANGETVTGKGFEYRVVGTSEWQRIIVTESELIATQANLLPRTIYQYRAYAETANSTVSTVYGNEIAFKTLHVPPIAETGEATNIRRTLTTVLGTITAGTEPIIAKGFEYRENSGGESEWIEVKILDEELMTILRKLKVSTRYDFRAFVETASGVVYGDVVPFTTATPPTMCEECD